MTSIIKVDQIQTAAGGVPTAADLGLNVSGTVLNVYHLTTGVGVNNTSANYTTVWSIPYTPVSTNSKIIISTSLNIRTYRNGGTDSRAAYRLLIDNSEYLTHTHAGAYDYGGGGIWLSVKYVDHIQYINQTGNQITVSVQTSTNNLGPEVYFNDPAQSHIVFTEIAG